MEILSTEDATNEIRNVAKEMLGKDSSSVITSDNNTYVICRSGTQDPMVIPRIHPTMDEVYISRCMVEVVPVVAVQQHWGVRCIDQITINMGKLKKTGWFQKSSYRRNLLCFSHMHTHQYTHYVTRTTYLSHSSTVDWQFSHFCTRSIPTRST